MSSEVITARTHTLPAVSPQTQRRQALRSSQKDTYDAQRMLKNALPPVIAAILALMAYNAWSSWSSPVVPARPEFSVWKRQPVTPYIPEPRPEFSVSKSQPADDRMFANSCGDKSCESGSVCMPNVGCVSESFKNQTESESTSAATDKVHVSPYSLSLINSNADPACGLSLSVTSSELLGSTEALEYYNDAITITNTGSKILDSIEFSVTVPPFAKILNTFAMEKTCCTNTGSVQTFKVDLHSLDQQGEFGSLVIMYSFDKSANYEWRTTYAPSFDIKNRFCQ